LSFDLLWKPRPTPPRGGHTSGSAVRFPRTLARSFWGPADRRKMQMPLTGLALLQPRWSLAPLSLVLLHETKRPLQTSELRLWHLHGHCCRHWFLLLARWCRPLCAGAAWLLSLWRTPLPTLYNYSELLFKSAAACRIVSPATASVVLGSLRTHGGAGPSLLRLFVLVLIVFESRMLWSFVEST
jgi:hypothetical protein